MAIAVEGYKVANGSSGAGGAVSVTHGLTIASGDVLVAIFAFYHTGASAADNNGSYPFTEDYEWVDTVNGWSHAVYSRVAGSSEPSSYAWTTTAWMNYSITLLQLSGVDTDAIWDVPPSDSTRDGGYGTTATADSQTTTTDGALALFYVQSGSADVSDPTNGFGDVVAQTTASKQFTYRKAITSAGAIGSTSATVSAATVWRCHLLALTPGATFLPHIMRHHFIPELGGH